MTCHHSSAREAAGAACPSSLRVLALACGAVLLTGLGACTVTTEGLTSNKIDYRSAPTRTAPLEVPPDLSQLSGDPRYQKPASGAVVSAAEIQASTTPADTASELSIPSVADAVAPKRPGAAPAAKPASPVVGTPPAATPASKSGDVRIERSGDQRWLVTNLPADKLWPILRNFWQESGLTVTVDKPDVGVMETDWAQNRAKLPQDFVRRTVGKVLDSLYDTSQRDRYVTRIERSGSGTEVYISHRSLVETVVGDRRNEQTKWIAGPNDPNMEAEFLGRLMLKLSAGDPSDAKSAAAAVESIKAAPVTTPPRARAVEGTTTALEVDDAFDRAWRRVSLSLDRAGYTVEDRDRRAGFFDIRYVDPKFAGMEEPGFFSRMFGAKDPEGRTGVRYRVKVSANATGGGTRVEIQGPEGQTRQDSGSQSIRDQLLQDLH